MTTSDSIKWNVDDPEVFEFFATSFDVRKAKKIIVAKPREIHTAKTTDVEGMIGMIRIDRMFAVSDKVDTSIPLIVASLPENSKLVIDGWHRIAKASALEVERLPIVLLDDEETFAIMGGAGRRRFILSGMRGGKTMVAKVATAINKTKKGTKTA